MADSVKGRQLVVLSLCVIVVLTIALSVFAGGVSSPATTYGRPVVVGLGCILVWQGRLWARWLLVLLGLGVIFAGPLAMANGLPFSSSGGMLAWTASGLYLASLLALFFSPDAKAFLASTADKGASLPPASPS